MSYKTDHKIEGFFEYVVPPLEGFWLRSGADKSAFRWISVIRLPDFVTRVDFDWAVETAARKKNLDWLRRGAADRRRGAVRADDAPRLL